MNTVSITISILAILAAIFGSFRSMRWAPAAGWCALAALTAASAGAPGWQTILFWGIAAAIALAINVMLPDIVTRTNSGTPFIAGGALAGTFTGLIMSQPAMIGGAVIGALFGALAFGRMAAGRAMGFPSRRYFNYVLAKGFPAVITTCLCGLAVLYIINVIHSTQ